MTHPPELTDIEICRARTALRHKLDPLLRGYGLEIRELATALAIGNPTDPAKGRIHITYVTGDVSVRRVTWDYLGPLQGYEPDDDPDREPGIDATKIITTLTGEPPSPGDMTPGPRPGPGGAGRGPHSGHTPRMATR
jgi:hypothetical protein